MTLPPGQTATAFHGLSLLARGALADVALAVRQAAQEGADRPILVFDDETGRVIDLDLRGDAEALMARYRGDTPAPRGRGRPRLGVTAREVTLLPRQWDWLATQPGGASATLRRLVDQARRADAGQTETRTRRDAAYRAMSALAGDLPGFEEASRALFGGEPALFAARIGHWPADLRAYLLRLLDAPPAG
jgi:hypothetical protein